MFGNAGLRGRLLIGGLAVVGVLMVGSASLNYQWARSTLENEARNRLNEDWAAMKGYLRIEYADHRETDQWYFDDSDADQATAVNDIRQRCFIADVSGRVLRGSALYQDAGLDSPAKISSRIRQAVSSSEVTKTIWSVRQGARGSRYLMRESMVFDALHRTPYYVALAVPLSNFRALLEFTLTLAGTIVSAMLLGWVLARALTPVSPPRGGSV